MMLASCLAEYQDLNTDPEQLGTTDPRNVFTGATINFNNNSRSHLTAKYSGVMIYMQYLVSSGGASQGSYISPDQPNNHPEPYSPAYSDYYSGNGAYGLRLDYLINTVIPKNENAENYSDVKAIAQILLNYEQWRILDTYMPERAMEDEDFYINQDKMHTFTPLITYPETCLMLAEIAVKKGGAVAGKDAKGWFQEGVKASMEQYRDWAANMYVVAQTTETAANYSPVTDDKINAYLARPEFTDITLEKIISQQWVNLYMQPEEMWATWKRTGLPAFKEKPEPAGGVAVLEEIRYTNNTLTIPRRNSLGTPNTLNIANYNAAIDALKSDAKYGTDTDRTEGRIWWDVE